jgi:hypothetical protein
MTDEKLPLPDFLKIIINLKIFQNGFKARVYFISILIN